MDGDCGGEVEVGVGDGRVVDGEVGGSIVGDENGHGGQESGEARVGGEALEIGEREALRDDMVGEDEWVQCGGGSGGGGCGVVRRDEEGGGDGKRGGIGGVEEVGPSSKVAGADEGVDYVVQLLLLLPRWWSSGWRRRKRRRCR